MRVEYSASDAPPVEENLKTWTGAGAQKDIDSQPTTSIIFKSKSNKEPTAESATDKMNVSPKARKVSKKQ